VAAWGGYGDPQHTAPSSVASQSLGTIRWQTPVDPNPQTGGSDLLVRCGSPVITAGNAVVVPAPRPAGRGPGGTRPPGTAHDSHV
jgi:hypothetical protein